MVEHVRRSFSEILHELTWLEDSTRKVAQAKVCRSTSTTLCTLSYHSGTGNRCYFTKLCNTQCAVYV